MSHSPLILVSTYFFSLLESSVMSEVTRWSLFFIFPLKIGFSSWELLIVVLGQWAQEGQRGENSPGMKDGRWRAFCPLLSSPLVLKGVRERLPCRDPALHACSQGAGSACKEGSPGGSFSWMLSQIWGSQPENFS